MNTAKTTLQTDPAPAPVSTSPVPTLQPIRLRPAVDLIEEKGGFVMLVEMPGVHHESVTVAIERDELTITGNADFSVPTGSRWIAGAAGPRLYERTFQISDDIDRDQISAEVKQGVLTLRLPKADRAQKVTLSVKAG